MKEFLKEFFESEKCLSIVSIIIVIIFTVILANNVDMNNQNKELTNEQAVEVVKNNLEEITITEEEYKEQLNEDFNKYLSDDCKLAMQIVLTNMIYGNNTYSKIDSNFYWDSISLFIDAIKTKPMFKYTLDRDESGVYVQEDMVDEIGNLLFYGIVDKPDLPTYEEGDESFEITYKEAPKTYLFPLLDNTYTEDVTINKTYFEDGRYVAEVSIFGDAIDLADDSSSIENPAINQTTRTKFGDFKVYFIDNKNKIGENRFMAPYCIDEIVSLNQEEKVENEQQ